MKNTQVIPQKIGTWHVLEKIGEGSFGNIYKAKKSPQQVDKLTGCPQMIAIKTESINNIKQMLLLQYNIYREFQGQRGFPHVYEYVEEDIFSYLAMEKLQITLDKFAANKYPNHFLPTEVLLQIMGQILDIIEKMHKRGYLYRDLKPANLMLKAPYQEIFIIDFGLCKKYVVNNRHIPMKTNKKLVGTPIFCSLNTHTGLQQSRRDDMESWILTSLYFAMELPWESVINRKELTKQQQYQQIYTMKKQVKWQQLIKEMNQSRPQLTQIPSCIIKILESIRRMAFEQEPNYEEYLKLIKNEYKSLTGKEMKDYSINWQTNVTRMNIQGEQKKEIKKQSQQPKKVSKINFKAPLKRKQNIYEIQHQKSMKIQRMEEKVKKLQIN